VPSRRAASGRSGAARPHDLPARRVGRRQSAFAEETLARKIIANWKWDDMPPPKDLREAFLIHTIRSQSNEEARRRLLDLYKTAVREGVESGVVSRGEVHRLDALRSQLHISDIDHERVMAELADEHGGLDFAMAVGTSPEKQLQLDTYAEALAVHAERQAATVHGDEHLRPHQRGADVRRRVLLALLDVLPAPTLGCHPLERHLEVARDHRVGVLVDRQAGRRVRDVDEDRGRTVRVADRGSNLRGDLDELRVPVGGDLQLLHEAVS